MGQDLWRPALADPGEPAAAEHLLAVARDSLSRYAVDGLHLDDYFTPTTTAAAASSAFRPDCGGPCWHLASRTRLPPTARAGGPMWMSGGTLTRADWRRDNVNRPVKQLYAVVKKSDPAAKFGISPFGLPCPTTPPWHHRLQPIRQAGADVELWLREGWMDYLAPSSIGRAQAAQALSAAANLARSLNPRGIPLHPGVSPAASTLRYKAGALTRSPARSTASAA